MAKNEPAKEAVEAQIVIPHGLELDDDCTVVASDEEGVVVERAGVQFKITPSDHPAVSWDWIEIPKVD
jgi:hypothetical protein